MKAGLSHIKPYNPHREGWTLFCWQWGVNKVCKVRVRHHQIAHIKAKQETFLASRVIDGVGHDPEKRGAIQRVDEKNNLIQLI